MTTSRREVTVTDENNANVAAHHPARYRRGGRPGTSVGAATQDGFAVLADLLQRGCHQSQRRRGYASCFSGWRAAAQPAVAAAVSWATPQFLVWRWTASLARRSCSATSRRCAHVASRRRSARSMASSSASVTGRR